MNFLVGNEPFQRFAQTPRGEKRSLLLTFPLQRCSPGGARENESKLPGREGHVGGTAADNRLFVEAVLFRFRAGIPWRDLPERFGDWKIVYQRFNRWAKSGVFERVFRLLASDHDNEYMMIDATIVRAHQHSAGAQKKTVRKPSADPAAD